MDEIDVEGVAPLAEISLESVGLVVVGLQLNIGAAIYDPPPPAEQISPRELRILFFKVIKRRGVSCNPHLPSGIAVVKIALNGKSVANAIVPVSPEPRLIHSPIIEVPAV